ncbi:tetratricopeptide repeat protein [Streptomyces sp. JW3]|uniref:tetratricopeptide repeat protein n=1 Tax=Streptomyces sp. JW3 TaxID=3456955 RepID=UPI003FA480BF
MPAQQEKTFKWPSLMADVAAEGYPLLIARALVEPERYSRTDKVPQLAQLLDGALGFSTAVPDSDLYALLDLAFDVVLTIGAGSGYRGFEELLEYALRLIDVLTQRGAPTTYLLLSAARLQACLANQDPVRLNLIERAVSNSQSQAEYVTARLHLARFHVDISDYRGARKHVHACRAALGDQQQGVLGADLESTAGMAVYYTDPRRARDHFELAVRLGRQHHGHPDVSQPTASAMHYLGRIAVDNGNHQLALRLFVEGEKLSDGYLTRHGFYHQRLAEVLTDHGSATEAAYHLSMAESAFAQVGQVSNGLLLLQGSWARWYLHQNDQTGAEHILMKAISASRTDSAPRIELILQAELLRLRLRQRRTVEVMRVLARSAVLYATGEAMTGRHQLIQARTIFLMAMRFLRPSPASAAGRQVPQCPCGADHTRAPEIRTSTRGGP